MKEIPVLTDKHKIARRQYCNEMLNMCLDNIVFSDESYIEGRGRKRKVFHPHGLKVNKKIWSKKAFSVMVWGCISMKGQLYF